MFSRRDAPDRRCRRRASASAGAQSFPSRTITIVVPYPPGGPIDSLARLIAQEASADLKQPVVVENRPGAGGIARHRRGRARRARRLHADPRHQPDACHQPEPDQELAVRRGEGFRAGRGRRRDAACAGGAQGVRGAERRRRGGDGEGQARRAHLRLDGQRLGRASRRRAVQDQGRHRHAARAVQGARADDDRASGRPRRSLHRAAAGADRPADRIGQCPRARHRQRRAHAAARHACRPSPRAASPASRPTPGRRCSRRPRPLRR